MNKKKNLLNSKKETINRDLSTDYEERKRRKKIRIEIIIILIIIIII